MLNVCIFITSYNLRYVINILQVNYIKFTWSKFNRDAICLFQVCVPYLVYSGKTGHVNKVLHIIYFKNYIFFTLWTWILPLPSSLSLRVVLVHYRREPARPVRFSHNRRGYTCGGWQRHAGGGMDGCGGVVAKVEGSWCRRKWCHLMSASSCRK